MVHALDANAAVDAVYRSDWGRIVAALIRLGRDFDIAEEAACWRRPGSVTIAAPPFTIREPGTAATEGAVPDIREGTVRKRLQFDFWASLWEYFAISASVPYTRVLDARTMAGARWFQGARLNYAEHALRHVLWTA